MNISARTEYACIAVLELAMNTARDLPIPLRDIAEKHGIPARFLVQILLQLKSAGVVNSIRGANGGYLLAMKPEEISLGDVMAVVEGKSCTITSNASLETPVSRALIDAWQHINDLQQAELEAVTIGELAESVRNETQNMYYI